MRPPPLPGADAGLPLTIEAGAVRTAPRVRSDPRVLTGGFSIRLARRGEPSISSAGFGGACLIARVPQIPKACHLDSQCDIRANARQVWHGYCLKEPRAANGTCWVKPSDAYCNKGPNVRIGEHQLPAVDTNEVYEFLVGRAASPVQPVNWMVYACLNGVYSSGKAPCARSDTDPDFNAVKRMNARGPISPRH
ncbi:hypothetical protein G7078_08570 [Sphingomonas sinipercae]|uniref:Uncharacterized protein n=1 Tax=Sphingomonas sinipercae TaxID=2714944 RepID=A0A6G7ZPK3_9SPHN|nr:hypothetical protein [Sphingomonas sinipercae]QIL02830.1 hypothetical protein G7078_08570 [Sphingomonas sinipercae]